MIFFNAPLCKTATGRFEPSPTLVPSAVARTLASFLASLLSIPHSKQSLPHNPLAQQPIDPELPPSAEASPAPAKDQPTAPKSTTQEGRRIAAQERLRQLREAQDSLHTRFHEMHRELGPQAMNVFAEVNQQQSRAAADLHNDAGLTPTPAEDDDRAPHCGEQPTSPAEFAAASVSGTASIGEDATLTPPSTSHSDVTPSSTMALPLRLAFTPDDVVRDSEAAMAEDSRSDADDSTEDGLGEDLTAGPEPPFSAVASTPKRPAQTLPAPSKVPLDLESETSSTKAPQQNVLSPVSASSPVHPPPSARNALAASTSPPKTAAHAASVSNYDGKGPAARKPPAAKQLFGDSAAKVANGDTRHQKEDEEEDDDGTGSSSSSSRSRLGSLRQSPDLSRMDEVFETCLIFDLVHINRLGQAVSRMIEVTGNSRLAILDNDNGSEVNRYDLQLLVNVTRQARAARPVLQLTFVHALDALGDERVLRLTYLSEDKEDVEELSKLQEVLENIAIDNQAARAHENVAIRIKCIACQHVLDAEERRFLVDDRRECPSCGSSEVYDLNKNEAAEGETYMRGSSSGARPIPVPLSMGSSVSELLRSPQQSPGLARRPSSASTTPRRLERVASSYSTMQGAKAEYNSGTLRELGEEDEDKGNAEVCCFGKEVVLVS